MDNMCMDCEYWKPFKDNTGECYCKAPLPYIHETEMESLHKVTRWPLTNQHQGCSEFVAKE